jgi:hypothetical protein
MSYNISYLQELILRVCEFLWKYENSFEVEFTIFTPLSNPVLVQFSAEMNRKMGNNCLVIAKQIY